MNTSKPCDRNYNDGGAHTVQRIDGVDCCPSCKQPIAEHKKQELERGK